MIVEYRLSLIGVQISALNLAIAMQVCRRGRVELGAALLPLIEERNAIIDARKG